MSSAQDSKRQDKERVHSLGAEAKRLMDFKREHVTKNDLTPCPQCATPVNIRAVKCPQCTSDIARHTQNVRDELQKLEKVTAELNEIHLKEMELFQQEAGQTPVWERLRSFFSEPRLLQDMKIVLPILIGLFTVVIFLRENASGLVFLLGSMMSGFAVYSLFKKWQLNKYMTVDLYRTTLIFGLVLVLSGISFDSEKFWPDLSASAKSGSSKGSVVVKRPVANIRQEPTTDSPIITTAHNGEKLKLLERRGAWYRVKTQSGQSGWVYSSLVGDS